MAAHRRKDAPAGGAAGRPSPRATSATCPGDLICRNVTVSGRRTSLRLEPAFWDALTEICAREGLILNQLCTAVDRRRGAAALTQSVRVFVLCYFRSATPVSLTAAPPDRGGSLSPRLSALLDAIA